MLHYKLSSSNSKSSVESLEPPSPVRFWFDFFSYQAAWQVFKGVHWASINSILRQRMFGEISEREKKLECSFSNDFFQPDKKSFDQDLPSWTNKSQWAEALEDKPLLRSHEPSHIKPGWAAQYNGVRSRFAPSGPGSNLGRDIFSLLLSLWTVLR